MAANGILIAVLVAGCGRLGYDPAGSGEADAGPDHAPAAADPDSRVADAAADAAGSEESCPPGETCMSTCSSSCDFLCDTGAMCDVECPSSDCTMTCAPGSRCTLHCGTVPLDGTCAGSGGTSGVSFRCTGENACGGA